MTMKSWAIFLPLAFATQELTSKTFSSVTESGNGMVKFFQPWCGHCTRMKPDWDRLAEDAHSSVFIADVNCSDEEELCSDVSGYPTIKVYKDGAVEKYEGGRSFEDLMEYVEENLAVKCDISNIDENCHPKAEGYVAKWKAKDEAAVQKEIHRLTGMQGKAMEKNLKSTYFL